MSVVLYYVILYMLSHVQETLFKDLKVLNFTPLFYFIVIFSPFYLIAIFPPFYLVKSFLLSI